ncbi:hypothetical protein SDD30_13235 [Moorella naiadis]|uniref:hypothetical protein n=1 Tax=Moorella naiadis (nom. illeg.) TaxID=3093670 RepID=UPI003D9C9C36
MAVDCITCKNYRSSLCNNCEFGDRVLENYYELALSNEIEKRFLENLREQEKSLGCEIISREPDEKLAKALKTAKELVTISPEQPYPCVSRAEYLVFCAGEDLLKATNGYLFCEIHCSIPSELSGKNIVYLENKMIGLYPGSVFWEKHMVDSLCEVNRKINFSAVKTEDIWYGQAKCLIMPDATLRLNKRFLEKVLNVLGKDFEVAYNDADRHQAVVFAKDNIRIAVMPMVE